MLAPDTPGPHGDPSLDPAAITIFLAFVALLLVGGWGVSWSRAHEACCAACGYPAAGLEKSQCPECGASLEGEGLTPARGAQVHRPSLSVRVACRTLLAVIAGAGLLIVMSDRFPVECSSAWLDTGVKSGAFKLHLRASGEAPGDPTHRGVVGIARWNTTILINGPTRTITVELLDHKLRARWTDASGTSRQTDDMLTEDDLSACIAASGVPTPDAREVRAVYHALRNICAGTLSPDYAAALDSDALAGPAGSTGRTYGPRRWVWLAAGPGAFLLWAWMMRTVRRGDPITLESTDPSA